jgi:quercetin dioxygenase-like cupin family protein
MSEREPVVRADGEGERLRFWGGGILTMKATSGQTGGALLVFEDEMARGKTTPLHTHAEAELLYVLEGELLVHVDGVQHVVAAYGSALAPGSVPHAFCVTSDTARVLTVQGPGTAEAFYRGASDPAGADADPAAAVDVGRVIAAAQRTGGMQVLGPPPFVAAGPR